MCGNLMNFYRDEDTGKYVLAINPGRATFYGRTQWTPLDWAQRQQLRGKPLALWLHGFYATHAANGNRNVSGSAAGAGTRILSWSGEREGI